MRASSGDTDARSGHRKRRSNVFGVHRAGSVRIHFDPFGWNIYSYGLVHYSNYGEKIRCGEPAQHGPPLTVNKNQPVSCLFCLVYGDPR